MNPFYTTDRKILSLQDDQTLLADTWCLIEIEYISQPFFGVHRSTRLILTVFLFSTSRHDPIQRLLVFVISM
jgi:hypothetical protein